MKLFIDSTDNRWARIKIGDREYANEVLHPRDQNIFGFLMECLDKSGVSLKEITNIEVNPGPGSFTGTRVGVSIANALAFALGIKVNGKQPPIEPVYSAPPNITKKHP